jgi:hypothetical protein
VQGHERRPEAELTGSGAVSRARITTLGRNPTMEAYYGCQANCTIRREELRESVMESVKQRYVNPLGAIPAQADDKKEPYCGYIGSC